MRPHSCACYFLKQPTVRSAAIGELRWYWWDAGEPDTGWTLRLAVEDPLDGLAWAVSATDAA